MKPKRRCRHAGCRELIDFNIIYCEKHKVKKGKENYSDRMKKEGRYQKFYQSKQWRNTSRIYRLSNPMCEHCLANDRIIQADVVDHIIEIKDNWDKRLDKNNLQSLCHFHHNIKTIKEKKKRNNNS